MAVGKLEVVSVALSEDRVAQSAPAPHVAGHIDLYGVNVDPGQPADVPR